MPGVRGLNFIVQQNPQLLQDYQLHDSKIVIVGNILQNIILNQGEETRKCGGDYLEYARKLFDFFSMLQQCHVTPYVIMYGDNNQYEKKFHQNQSKKMEEQVQSIEEGKFNRIRPLLTHETFRHVIHSLNLPFFVQQTLDFREIAMLANDLNCPVLCDLSDFYVYPLTAGYIRFTTNTVLKVPEERSMDGTSAHKYLPCRIYFAENLTKCFSGLKNDALVVIATLLGNDYLTKKEIWRFYEKKIMPIQNQNNLPLTFDPNFPEVMKLMNWISQQRDLACTIEEVLECFTANQDEIMKSIDKSIDRYGLHAMKHTQPLIEYFQGIRKYHQMKADPNVPEWLQTLYQRGEISIVIPRLISTPRMAFFSQIEDLKSPSSFECATSLRQVVYGILTCTSSSNGRVDEISRDKCSLKSIKVDPVEGTPSLLDIPLLDKHLRKLIMLDALQNTNHNTDLPSDAKFFTAIIEYCLVNSDPKLNRNHVYALICCFLFMNVNFESLLYQTKEKSTMQDAMIMTSAQTIENLETKMGHLSLCDSQMPVIHVIHAFAQFQACFLAALDLNQLLLCPFPNLNPARVIHGTFLHNVFNKLEASTIPKSIIKDMLEETPYFLEMFNKMESDVLPQPLD